MFGPCAKQQARVMSSWFLGDVTSARLGGIAALNRLPRPPTTLRRVATRQNAWAEAVVRHSPAPARLPYLIFPGGACSVNRNEFPHRPPASPRPNDRALPVQREVCRPGDTMVRLASPCTISGRNSAGRHGHRGMARNDHLFPRINGRASAPVDARFRHAAGY